MAKRERFLIVTRDGMSMGFYGEREAYHALGQYYPKHEVSDFPRVWTDATVVTVYPPGKDKLLDWVAAMRKEW
jgi:hypothetical protein